MKKYENFCKALNNLKEIQKEIPPYSTVVQTGMVFLYEICFKQAWKAMKEVLENNIDIFIDDRASNCMKLMEHGISCILFRTIYERRTFSNLDSVSNWEELYNKIRSYSINEEK